jgi:hypothetical protein
MYASFISECGMWNAARGCGAKKKMERKHQTIPKKETEMENENNQAGKKYGYFDIVCCVMLYCIRCGGEQTQTGLSIGNSP